MLIVSQNNVKNQYILTVATTFSVIYSVRSYNVIVTFAFMKN